MVGHGRGRREPLPAPRLAISLTANEAGVARGRHASSTVGSNSATPTRLLRREVYSVLKQADFDYQRLQYNTVVSAAMKMLNARRRREKRRAAGRTAPKRYSVTAARAVSGRAAPDVPALAGTRLCATNSVRLLDAPWPKVDEKALEQSEIELVLQVNGKVRGALTVAKDASRESIEQLAAAHEMVAKFSEGTRAEEDRRRAGPSRERGRLTTQQHLPAGNAPPRAASLAARGNPLRTGANVTRRSFL